MGDGIDGLCFFSAGGGKSTTHLRLSRLAELRFIGSGAVLVRAIGVDLGKLTPTGTPKVVGGGASPVRSEGSALARVSAA